MDQNAYVAVPMDALTSPSTSPSGAASSGRRRRWMELEYLWLVVLLGAALCFFLVTPFLLARQSHDSYATISLSSYHNHDMAMNHGHMRGNMGGMMHHPSLKHRHDPQRPTHDWPEENTLEELHKDELQQETVERVNEGESVEEEYSEEETYSDEDSEEQVSSSEEYSYSDELDGSFSKESSDGPEDWGYYSDDEVHVPAEEEIEKPQQEPAMVERVSEGEVPAEEEEKYSNKDSSEEHEETPGELRQDGAYVAKLTAENFDEFLEQHDAAFIDMFTSWCTWSQRLAPTWEKFAEEVAKNDMAVGVASIDCEDQADLCQKQHVMAYPTLRWYQNKEASDYKMDRTVEAFMEFAKRKLNDGPMTAEMVPEGETVERYRQPEEVSSSEEYSYSDELDSSYSKESSDELEGWEYYSDDEAPPKKEIKNLRKEPAKVERINEGEEEEYSDEYSEAHKETLEELHKDGVYVVKLTAENFDEFLEQHEKAFINMYTPWSVWCQRLAPTWEEFAQEVAKNDNMPVGVASIDCEDQADLCRKQHVMAFPTLRWYQNKRAVSPDYKMDRTVEALMEFAQRKLGLNDDGPMIVEPTTSSKVFLDNLLEDSDDYVIEEEPLEEEVEELERQQQQVMVERVNEGD